MLITNSELSFFWNKLIFASVQYLELWTSVGDWGRFSVHSHAHTCTNKQTKSLNNIYVPLALSSSTHSVIVGHLYKRFPLSSLFFKTCSTLRKLSGSFQIAEQRYSWRKQKVSPPQTGLTKLISVWDTSQRRGGPPPAPAAPWTTPRVMSRGTSLKPASGNELRELPLQESNEGGPDMNSWWRRKKWNKSEGREEIRKEKIGKKQRRNNM